MSYIRVGDDVGLIVLDGKVDILIGFEMSEAVRNVNKVNKDFVIVLNNRFVRFKNFDLKKQ